MPCVCKSLHEQHSYPIHGFPAQTGAREKHRGSIYSPCHPLPESFVTRSSKYSLLLNCKGPRRSLDVVAVLAVQTGASHPSGPATHIQRSSPEKQKSIRAAMKIPATMEAASHQRGCIAANLFLFPRCCVLLCLGSGSVFLSLPDCWNNLRVLASVPRTTVALPPGRKRDSLRIQSSLEQKRIVFRPVVF